LGKGEGVDTFGLESSVFELVLRFDLVFNPPDELHAREVVFDFFVDRRNPFLEGLGLFVLVGEKRVEFFPEITGVHLLEIFAAACEPLPVRI
jgi:hypothetical protein